MSDTSLSALLPSVRLLLLGYGHVAQAFLPLLASRSEWLGNELGVLPVISGIGTRSRGFHIHPQGIDAPLLSLEADPLQRFISASTYVENKGDILQVGKDTTSVISIETEAMGTISLVEHEPTVIQTAYGVLSDLVTILKQRAT